MLALTDDQLNFLAGTASWKFNVDFKVPWGDPVVFSGDGVDDLDMLISRLQNTGPIVPRIQADVGHLFSQYIDVFIPDLQALRQRYIDLHGDVNKPQEPFEIPTGTASELPIT